MGPSYLGLSVPLGQGPFPAHASMCCSQGERMEAVQDLSSTSVPRAALIEAPPSMGLCLCKLASDHLKPKPQVGPASAIGKKESKASVSVLL